MQCRTRQCEPTEFGSLILATVMSTETASQFNATVIGREEIHPELIVLRVRPDDKLFDFKPGQFAVLGLRDVPGAFQWPNGKHPRPMLTSSSAAPIASRPPAWNGAIWSFTSLSSLAAGSRRACLP